MPIPGLTLIGESINDSVPPTHLLFDSNDFAGIQQLARFQAERGAAYLDVNVGLRDPGYMAEVVRAIQEAVSIPLSLDSPDCDLLCGALGAYDPRKAGGMKPIINSISELRTEIFDLLEIQGFRAILMSSERMEDGEGRANRSGEEVHRSARTLFKIAASPPYDFAADDLIVDPSLAPIGADFEGYTQMALNGMLAVNEDPEMKGVHMSVGLSNFSVMLPRERKSGGAVKTPLECALLTLAIPRGLDHIIGSVRKNYEILSDDHPALIAVKEAVARQGYEVVERIQQFYR
jgi:5-methyltetrahydrofolate--homocysteine methyltransferase